MKSLVRPELPTASVGSSQATTAAVDNSAPLATRPESTYKSGKVVQTIGATSPIHGKALIADNSPQFVDGSGACWRLTGFAIDRKQQDQKYQEISANHCVGFHCGSIPVL